MLAFACACLDTGIADLKMSKISWRYYFVYIFMCCYLLTVAYFTFPETKGRSLESIAVVFVSNGRARSDWTQLTPG